MNHPVTGTACWMPEHTRSDRVCGHDDSDCLDHFTTVSMETMNVSGPSRAIAGINHLSVHGWLGRALTVWSALYDCYAFHTPASRARAVEHLATVDWEALRQRGVWGSMLRTFTFAVTHHDGHNVLAVLDSIWDLGERDQLCLITSILRSTFSALNGSPTATARGVNLFHLYGFSVNTPEKYEVLPLLVEAVDQQVRDDETEIARLFAEVARLEPSHGVAALSLACASIGRLVDTEQAQVFLSDAPSVAARVDEPLSGVLLWRDESMDVHRSDAHLAACNALRMAADLIVGDHEKASRRVQAAANRHKFVYETTYAAVLMLADHIGMCERSSGTADRVGEEAGRPEPGIPGDVAG